MTEMKQVFDMVTRQIEPDRDSWRQLEERRWRSTRNRKVRALALAAVIVAAIALFASTALNRGKEGSAPATFAPSASGLAFTVVGLDGSVQSTIPGLPLGAGHPDVSPDGTRVAFVIQHGAESRIATVRLDGTGLLFITKDSISADRPRWSPDGSQLLFYRTDPPASRHLMVVNTDGTNVREIRGVRQPENVPPDWSPDGSLILYTSLASGRRDLATVPATGGPSQRLTLTPRVDDGPGTWSPDGSLIAYTRGEGLHAEVWLMNADGGGQHRLAWLPDKDAAAPEWSPDGSTIAFIGSVPGNLGGIGSVNARDSLYVVDVATGDVTEVLRGIASWTIFDSRATWLPDGKTLLVLTETP
jgi:Tol biopolymer transport system component